MDDKPKYTNKIYYSPEALERRRAYTRQYHKDHLAEQRARNAVWRWNRRLKIIDAYGGKCVCCGEDHPEFLVFDHVNGGGTAERRIDGNGTDIVGRIERLGYPDWIQLLCSNCNMAKERPQGCPHKRSTP
jgi:hypothetical protein